MQLVLLSQVRTSTTLTAAFNTMLQPRTIAEVCVRLRDGAQNIVTTHAGQQSLNGSHTVLPLVNTESHITQKNQERL